MDETLELTAEARAPRRRRRARRDAVLRPRPAAGPVRLVLAHRAGVPGPPDPRLQRADPGRGRHHPGDGRPAAPRARRTSSGSRRRRKDFEHVSYVLDECGDRLHRALRASSCSATRCSCSAAAGTSAASATSRPQPVAELYDAFAAGDHERARALHYDLHPLVDAAFAETNPVPAKWVMEQHRDPAFGARPPSRSPALRGKPGEGPGAAGRQPGAQPCSVTNLSSVSS